MTRSALSRTAWGLDSDPAADWRQRANCSDLKDPDQMYPHPLSPPAITAAKRICAACPVARQCLDEANRLGDYEGVQGGLTGEERKALARPKPINCRDCEREFVPPRADQVRCPWCMAARTPKPKRTTCPTCRARDVRVRADGSLGRHRVRGSTRLNPVYCTAATTPATPIGA